jgi:large subunit ribosomal protein L10
MNRQEKLAIVEHLKESFTESAASFVVNYQGLTVVQMQKLRKELRQQGGTLKVAKARLVKRAVSGVGGVDTLMPFLKEQIGIVFADKEISAIAKVLHDFAKDNEAFELVVGHTDSKTLTAGDVVRIASLPSRQVLLAQVCATLQAPSASLVRVLNGATLQLLWALNQVGEQKQSGTSE